MITECLDVDGSTSILPRWLGQFLPVLPESAAECYFVVGLGVFAAQVAATVRPNYCYVQTGLFDEKTPTMILLHIFLASLRAFHLSCRAGFVHIRDQPIPLLISMNP